MAGPAWGLYVTLAPCLEKVRGPGDGTAKLGVDAGPLLRCFMSCMVGKWRCRPTQQ